MINTTDQDFEPVLGQVVSIRRRSWLGRLLLYPRVFMNHYRILRKHNGFFASIHAADTLAMVLLK